MKNDQKSSKMPFFLINFAKNVKNGIENKHFFADITKLSWSEEMSFMYVLYLRGRGCERQKNGQKWPKMTFFVVSEEKSKLLENLDIR